MTASIRMMNAPLPTTANLTTCTGSLYKNKSGTTSRAIA
jgi:hypothetical protein